MSSDEDDSSIAQWAMIAGIVLLVALLVGGFLLRRDGLEGDLDQKSSSLKYALNTQLVAQCEKAGSGLNIPQEVGIPSIETHRLANGSKMTEPIRPIIED